MHPIEIVVIVLVSLFVLFMIGRFIYKKVKHMPTSECDCVGKKNRLVKDYHKKYKNEKKDNKDSECCCCSNKENK